MRIEVHPKPDGMQHVNLMFCEVEPDPEDLWVRERLEAFPIPPKRVLQWEREGRQYQVWQYGECVIGDGLFFIERHARFTGDGRGELTVEVVDETKLRERMLERLDAARRP